MIRWGSLTEMYIVQNVILIHLGHHVIFSYDHPAPMIIECPAPKWLS